MQFLIIPLHKKIQIASEKGFTLIEMITVILLLGIIGVMGSEVITSSFKGFSETDARMELFEEGKMALMRMEREIHHMVPNAVNTPDADTIRFGVIDVNTLIPNPPIISGQYESFGNAAKIRDLSLNPLPADSSLLSINNTSWDDFSSTNTIATKRKIYNITGTANPTGSMALHKAIIGGHSPTKRYYPVLKAVQYDLVGAVLFRHETPVTYNDDFEYTLITTPGFPLLSNIKANTLTFSYAPASLISNALIRINFTLERKGIILDFHKEIQVRNVP
jgi:MSHA biogenesis protein MshO